MLKPTSQNVTVKVCFVPRCSNTTLNSAKLFITVPKVNPKRLMWFKAVSRKFVKTELYCCEDHFDLETDMDNWIRYRLQGGRMILKPEVVPHKKIGPPVKKIKYGAKQNQESSEDEDGQIKPKSGNFEDVKIEKRVINFEEVILQPTTAILNEESATDCNFPNFYKTPEENSQSDSETNFEDVSIFTNGEHFEMLPVQIKMEEIEDDCSALKLEEFFECASSKNIPALNCMSVAVYLNKNLTLFGAENRKFQNERTGNENLGDTAIYGVQLKRENKKCFIKGIVAISPEKTTNIDCEIDEEKEQILQLICSGCTYSLGCCVHSITFIMWLHRRHEEPTTINEIFFWDKPIITNINSEIKTEKETPSFDQLPITTPTNDLSMVALIQKFTNENQFGFGNFLRYCNNQMTHSLCRKIEMSSRKRDNDLRQLLRFGRITAAKADQAVHSPPNNTTLIDLIFDDGSYKQPEDPKKILMKEQILDKLAESHGFIFRNPGLFLNGNYPFFIASVDAICDEFLFVVKCPPDKRLARKYVARITQKFMISPRYETQVQMQMLLTGKKKAVFCVANPDFETTGSFKKTVVLFNENYCAELIKKTCMFWETSVFPELQKFCEK